MRRDTFGEPPSHFSPSRKNIQDIVIFDWSYWWSLSDDWVDSSAWITNVPKDSWWGIVQKQNFDDTTVDEAGNPLISLEPSTPAQLAWFNNAVAECVQRTYAENASLT